MKDKKFKRLTNEYRKQRIMSNLEFMNRMEMLRQKLCKKAGVAVVSVESTIPQYQEYSCLEELLCIRVTDIGLDERLPVYGYGDQWEELISYPYTLDGGILTLTVRIVGILLYAVEIKLSSDGAHRRRFVCPECNRTVELLYTEPPQTGVQLKFSCEKCKNLVRLSQLKRSSI